MYKGHGKKGKEDGRDLHKGGKDKGKTDFYTKFGKDKDYFSGSKDKDSYGSWKDKNSFYDAKNDLDVFGGKNEDNLGKTAKGKGKTTVNFGANYYDRYKDVNEEFRNKPDYNPYATAGGGKGDVSNWRGSDENNWRRADVVPAGDDHVDGDGN